MGKDSRIKLERRIARDAAFAQPSLPTKDFWADVFGWTSLSWISAAFLAVATCSLSLSKQFYVARAAFVLAVLPLSIKSLFSLRGLCIRSLLSRLLFTLLVTFLALLGAKRWVDLTEANVAAVARPVPTKSRNDESLRPVFIREWDQPLRGIFAVIALKDVATLSDLQSFACVTAISFTEDRNAPSIYISSFSEKQLLPMGFGPTDGIQSKVWLSPPFRDEVGTFLFSYQYLKRLEAGGTFSDGKSIGNLGKLDRAFVQLRCSPGITKRIKSLRIYANDFLVYENDGWDMSWKPLRYDPNWKANLDQEIKWMNFQDADLKQFTIDLSSIRLQRVKILASGGVWTPSAETIMPGAYGWLTDEVDQ
ncbi:hypothetical protein [Terriglobus sp. ADX1]|uniref:hypothetical protein n=1 Tax=Terriglobus sp. ADX1 TaxID=2794063 RepID=UPI002FE5B12B